MVRPMRGQAIVEREQERRRRADLADRRGARRDRDELRERGRAGLSDLGDVQVVQRDEGAEVGVLDRPHARWVAHAREHTGTDRGSCSR